MKRRLVIEHKITSADGEKFPPIVIPAEQFGTDFDRYEGETHIHSDGIRGDIPVSFHQTFLSTDKTDDELIRDFAHAKRTYTSEPMKYLQNALASWLIRKVMKRLLLQLRETGTVAHEEVIIQLYSDDSFYVGVGNTSGFCCLGEVPAVYEATSSDSLLEAITSVESMMKKEPLNP